MTHHLREKKDQDSRVLNNFSKMIIEILQILMHNLYYIVNIALITFIVTLIYKTFLRRSFSIFEQGK